MTLGRARRVLVCSGHIARVLKQFDHVLVLLTRSFKQASIAGFSFFSLIYSIVLSRYVGVC